MINDVNEAIARMEQTVARPAPAESPGDDARVGVAYGSKHLKELLNEGRGRDWSAPIPLVSPGGVFGTVMLAGHDVSAGRGAGERAAAEDYARLASAAIEAAAVGEALREECARMREARAE